MNFLNFLTSSSSLFNFNLQSTRSDSIRENTLLVQPQKSSPLTSTLTSDPPKDADSFAKKEQPEDAQNLKELLRSRDELISQYIELNMKYLSNQLGANVSQPEPRQESKSTEEQNNQKSKSFKKKIKKMNKCGHEDKSHYAKGMCNNCYHKYGRTKKPWNCPHDKLYAAGMCQNCYINNYNRKKREEKNHDDHNSSEIHEMNVENSQQ